MITDDEIRDYVRDNWRDLWKGGPASRGTVNDAAIILFSETTSHTWKASIREEFARLITRTPTPGKDE